MWTIGGLLVLSVRELSALVAKGLVGKLAVDVMGLAGFLCKAGVDVSFVALRHVVGKLGAEAGLAAMGLVGV